MPIRQIEALELSELLGSMLSAFVDAQERSARATVAFIEDVGFKTRAQADGTQVTELRTTSLRYRKRDENDVTTEFEVEIPVLTLVNPPAMAVAEAKLRFSYDILFSGTEREPSSSSGKRVVLRGLVRSAGSPPTPSGARESLAVDIDVTVRQLSLPIGIERLFNLAELGIEERRPPAPL